MSSSSSVSLETRILDLPSCGVAGLGAMTARRLAAGVAEISIGKDINTVSVEDLLLYPPMRYEDRSSFARIRDLTDGMKASLMLTVKVAGHRRVGVQRP